MKRAESAIRLLLAAAAAATLTAWLGGLFWGFELTDHFRVHIGLALALCVLAAFVVRRPRLAAVALIVLALDLWGLAAAWTPPHPAVAGPAAARLRVLHLNVQMDAHAHERVARYIDTVDPDVVLLVEVDAPWTDALASRLDAWPHRVLLPRDDFLGQALFSKLPLAFHDRHVSAPGGLPWMLADLPAGPATLRLVSVHALPWMGASWVAASDGLLADVAAAGGLREGPALVCGDFNLTPWATTFVRFLDTSGLRHAAEGLPWEPTWPASLPTLGLPIDHCLVSPELVVTRYEVGPDIGSDHRPVVVDIALPPR